MEKPQIKQATKKTHQTTPNKPKPNQPKTPQNNHQTSVKCVSNSLVLLVLSCKVRKHRQGWRPTEQEAKAAPAQLKVHVPSTQQWVQTEVASPRVPQCPCSVPPCAGKSLQAGSLLGSLLAAVLAANRTPAEWQLFTETLSCPIHHAEKQSEGSRDVPWGLERYRRFYTAA